MKMDILSGKLQRFSVTSTVHDDKCFEEADLNADRAGRDQTSKTRTEENIRKGLYYSLAKVHRSVYFGPYKFVVCIYAL